jgi:hypothetical protein
MRCRAIEMAMFVALFAGSPVSLRGQTIDDGIMVATHELFTGSLYSRATWDEYWEGALQRRNGNIGRITTQTDAWSATYGLADRLNVIAVVPHVRTRASQGVLRGMGGFQDVAVAAKYRFLERPLRSDGVLRALAVVSGSVPLTDYTPDFQPLSIGNASKTLSSRATLHVQSPSGWFVTGSTAYTWRSQVALDRPYYYTDGRLFFTNQVDMPNVLGHDVSGGYTKRGLMAAASLSHQRTLGGGDIRRQDMPFISNRMNALNGGAMVRVPVPKLQHLAVQLALAHTLDGRNVGKSTTVTTGLHYTFNGRPTP